MPQTGAAGFRQSDRDGDAAPSRIVAFDPVGEITAFDARSVRHRRIEDVPRRVSGPVRPSARLDDRGPVSADRGRSQESRAAARAAMADAFAAQFGIDDDGPSAASLADRFGFRFEESAEGLTGRRTVTITGRGAQRAVPPSERSLHPGGGARRRPDTGRSESFWLQPDRAALWAVGLALVLALVAAMSAHALPLP